MDDRLNSRPVLFDHPERLTEGVSLTEGCVVAKAFISEDAGCVKFNIVIENKTTGEVANRDVVIGEIVEEEEEEE